MKIENMSFKDYKQLLNDPIYISNGSEGTCYLIDDRVYKLFHEPIEKEFINEFADFNLELPSFIFYKSLLVIDDLIFGCTMDYVKGKNIDKMDLLSLPYDTLLNMVKIAENDILILSNNKILAYDICPVNILCDGKQFYFIDTTGYKKVDMDISQIYCENIKRFSMSIYRKLIYENPNINYFVEQQGSFYDDLNLLKPLQTLECLRKGLSDYCNRDLDSLRETEMALDIKKNR